MEADVPEFLAQLGYKQGATEQVWAIGDCTLMAFYYLLRIGEYTIKGSRNDLKQTEQFRMRDVRFFSENVKGRLRLLELDATDVEIMRAAGATLRLGNQKNG